MGRAGVVLGMWLVATVIATGLAWAAVQQVATDPVGQAPLVGIAPTILPTNTAPTGPPAPEDPATTDETAVTRTVDLVGGSVTVRFDAGVVELVAAVPASGFEADLQASGPERVDVRFESEDHESRLVADFDGGERRIRPAERPD